MRYALRLIFSLVAVFSLCVGTAQAELKVFILAGQSNMVGKGLVEGVNTSGTMHNKVINDPTNYGHLVDGAGNWKPRSDVWISARTDDRLKKGNLTVGYGYGYNANSASMIGPELGFGNVIGDHYDEQVLIIKTSWGGKKLATAFRSPSSGDFPDDVFNGDSAGEFYVQIISEVEDALSSLNADFGYDESQGYDIVGLGWHQGWGDGNSYEYANQYEVNMENFINDIRDDLGTAVGQDLSKMPFVIGSSGMAPAVNATHNNGTGNVHTLPIVRAGQAAMVDFDKYPEFEGNVGFVNTEGLYQAANVSPANESVHWNKNAESYYLVGSGMGDEMLTTIALGDFDGDEDVDGADFLSWQRGSGTDYNAEDLSVWQANYGNNSNSNAIAALKSIPEPSTLLLSLLGLLGIACRR